MKFYESILLAISLKASHSLEALIVPTNLSDPNHITSYIID